MSDDSIPDWHKEDTRSEKFRYNTVENKCSLTGAKCNWTRWGEGMDCRRCNVPIVIAIKEAKG